MRKKEGSCSIPKCRNAACYKIAATWSDGPRKELTTYGLACVEHCAPVFHDARRRKHVYPPSAADQVGELGIYRWDPSLERSPLVRLRGLEAKCRSWEPASLAKATTVGCS